MANRGPGTEPRAWAPVTSYTSDQYHPGSASAASHGSRASRYRERWCARPGMRPTDPNLLTRDREERVP